MWRVVFQCGHVMNWLLVQCVTCLRHMTPGKGSSTSPWPWVQENVSIEDQWIDYITSSTSWVTWDFNVTSFRFCQLRSLPIFTANVRTETRTTAIICNLTGTVLFMVQELHLFYMSPCPHLSYCTCQRGRRRVTVLTFICIGGAAIYSPHSAMYCKCHMDVSHDATREKWPRVHCTEGLSGWCAGQK